MKGLQKVLSEKMVTQKSIELSIWFIEFKTKSIGNK